MEEEQIGGGVRKKDKGNESASQFLGFPIMSQFTPTTFPSDTTFLANNLTMTRSVSVMKHEYSDQSFSSVSISSRWYHDKPIIVITMNEIPCNTIIIAFLFIIIIIMLVALSLSQDLESPVSGHLDTSTSEPLYTADALSRHCNVTLGCRWTEVQHCFPLHCSILYLLSFVYDRSQRDMSQHFKKELMYKQ